MTRTATLAALVAAFFVCGIANAQETQVTILGTPAAAQALENFCAQHADVCDVVDVTDDAALIQADALNRLATQVAAGSNPDAPGADGTNPGGNDAPVTAATTIHGTPGNVPAFGGSSASPGGNGAGDGNGIHNIAGGAPGWDGSADGNDGGQPACDMHGGLGDQYGTGTDC